MDTRPEDIVRQETTVLDEFDLPDVLEDNVRRQRRHLAGLAAALLSGGQEEVTVRTSVRLAFDSYRKELVRTLEALEVENAHVS